MIEFFWQNLPASSRVDLWLQSGAIANAASNPANFILAGFSLPAGGGKNQQSNVEVLCKPVPWGVDPAVFVLTNASPGVKGLTAMIGFLA
jgi:hypothetical protein